MSKIAISFRCVNSSNVFSMVFISVSRISSRLERHACVDDKEVLPLVLGDVPDSCEKKTCDRVLMSISPLRIYLITNDSEEVSVFEELCC
jgi:hypothetical protein